MTRVWTLEQLIDVHPLPDDDGWEWIPDTGVRGGWLAASGDGRVVCVLMDGRIRFGNMDDVPDRVALAVILMSQGLDSLATMTAKLEDWQRQAEREADTQTLIRMARCEGQAHAWGEAAVMLRRGTVAP